MKPCVLTYHSLDTSGSVISVAPSLFREQMQYLAASRIPVVPLAEIQNTPGGIALTFDDGFENFYTQAFPVLRKLHFPATVFVVSDYCGLRNNWPSQPGMGVPSLRLMTWEQLNEISRHGISLGAHTATHPRLSCLPARQVRQELVRCRETLQDRTGIQAETLAYPYGDSNAEVRKIAAEFFAAAFGTRPDYLTGQNPAMNLPRIDVYYLRQRLWFESVRKVQGQVYVAARRSLRALRSHGFSSAGQRPMLQKG